MRVASVAPDRQRKMNVGFLSNNIADLRLKTCLVIHMGFNVFDSQISLSCFSCSFFIPWKVWWCNNYITKLRTVQRPEFNSLHGRCGIPSNSHLKSLYLFPSILSSLKNFLKLYIWAGCYFSPSGLVSIVWMLSNTLICDPSMPKRLSYSCFVHHVQPLACFVLLHIIENISHSHKMSFKNFVSVVDITDACNCHKE